VPSTATGYSRDVVVDAHGSGAGYRLTGEKVSFCLLVGSLSAEDLPLRYETACDPRLNRSQALQLAVEVAELLRAGVQARPCDPVPGG